VFSEDDRGQRFRYRFMQKEVGEQAFLRSWRKTFLPKAPYMRRLALGRFRDGVRYLYKDKDPGAIFVITRAGEEARPLSTARIPNLSKIFGLLFGFAEFGLEDRTCLLFHGAPMSCGAHAELPLGGFFELADCDASHASMIAFDFNDCIAIIAIIRSQNSPPARVLDHSRALLYLTD
jgi:hypothetical protein